MSCSWNCALCRSSFSNAVFKCPFIATQLNFTRRRVELRRYRHPHRRNSISVSISIYFADDRQCNWPSWTAYSQSARSRSVMILFPVLHRNVWYTNHWRSFPEKCFLAPLLFYTVAEGFGIFSVILLTFIQILHSKIPGKLVKTRHIWRHGLQTELTGSRRSGLIGDSCSRCERVDNTFSLLCLAHKTSWICSKKIHKKVKAVFRVTLMWATKQTGSRNTGNEAIEARFGNVL